MQLTSPALICKGRIKKNIKSKKLKTAVITSFLTLALINSSPVLAYHKYHLHEYDFNSNFEIHLGGEGSTNNDESRTDYYLYWCANDTTFRNEIGGGTTTIKGGNWYIYSVMSPTDSDTSRSYTLIGELGMSEEEMKQAIDDAIHNVEGDQPVNGSQTVTGQQQVQGGIFILY